MLSRINFWSTEFLRDESNCQRTKACPVMAGQAFYGDLNRNESSLFELLKFLVDNFLGYRHVAIFDHHFLTGFR